MTLLAAARRWRPRSALRAWGARTVRQLGYLAVGVPLQLAGLALMALPWLLWVPVHVLVIVVAVIIPAGALLAVVPGLTVLQRRRARLLPGAELPPPARPGGPWWRRLAATEGLQATWQQLLYHLVAGPALACGALLTLGLWIGGVVLTLVYEWVWALPPDRLNGPIGYATGDAYLTGLGIIMLAAGAWLTGIMARLDARACAALLAPSRAAELAQRVERLTHSRADVLEAADTERRRIERDLHDGAQQRLVSLAMNLGMARHALTDVPDEARQVIDDAHREAKEALAELRNLVRGLHPAVLEDRGLDAALSGIAARAPLPVRVQVDMPRRAAPAVEAVAYFIVSEALTNVARHAAATTAQVRVRLAGDTLQVSVTDDGKGGADARRGTGLASLARRAASVDGSLRVASPAGGPTSVSAELPCGS